MKNREAMAVARRIATRAGVSVAEVMSAYRRAAHGAPVSAQMLFIEPAANVGR